MCWSFLCEGTSSERRDPKKTSLEWKRILKQNGIIIFSFSYDKSPTESDPVGGLKYDDVFKLFGGEVIYYNKHGSNYSDLILKINK